MTEERPFHVGLLVFPMLTQLDLTGPYEVLNRMPGAEVHLIGKTLDAVRSEHGLPIQPTTSFDDCPELDLLVVPGGFGVDELLVDPVTLDFVRRSARHASYVGSVCTGSLVLGAAGLLSGRRATSHWMSVEFLEAFGAIPVRERVVVDGNLFTGGGVTAGIDFALTIVAAVAGREAAEEIQLAIEYDPAPPFDSGSPDAATASIVAALKEKWGKARESRRARVKEAAARLVDPGTE